MTRKMLRLLCAAALVCGAAPMAMATGVDDDTARREQQMDQQQHRAEERARTVEAKQARAEEPQVEQMKLSALNRNEIRELQKALQERGYYEGEIDGIVGPLTYGALGAFQKAEGGKVTTRLDLQTARALELDFGEIQPVRGGGPEERDDDLEDDVESVEDDIRGTTESGPGDRVIEEMRDTTNTNVPEDEK